MEKMYKMYKWWIDVQKELGVVPDAEIQRLAESSIALRKSVREKELMLRTAALTEDERKRREETVRNEYILLEARDEALLARFKAKRQA